MLEKVSRINSEAEIIFSYPICVRYGKGLTRLEGNIRENKNRQDAERRDSNRATDLQRSPCPILEFRVVNKQSNVKGGEIINASVNVVATTVSSKDDSVSPHDWASVSVPARCVRFLSSRFSPSDISGSRK